jgi:hypothetical protein
VPSDLYDQMTNEELERHINMRGVPSGPREVFPGRRIIEWLRERDRDEARWADMEYDDGF